MGIMGATIFMNIGLYPKDFFPNFTSFFVIVTTGIVSGITLLSTLYPASKASRLSVPSLTRRWKIPEPVGDLWSIPLPFTVTPSEIWGLFTFLKEYLQMYGTGGDLFLVRDLRLQQSALHDRSIVQILAHIQLAPFDLGLMQRLAIRGVLDAEGKYHFSIECQRISGVLDSWLTSNRVFIDRLRKQFLIWRLLSTSEKETYIKRGIEQE
jgi:hypothetical protein